MFQKSVLNSISQDESKVALRWAEYQKYLSKIDFIKSVKEEKYQDGFLKDVFEECLGYTLDSTNPSNFNLEREKKNETDGKKADGVIYVDDKIVGIIELKAQDTKNLDKIESQAFNYHASHSNSKYIIISNFDELRFYIDKKTAYEKFSLFTLSYEEFKKLHLLLSYESIKTGIPLKLKEKTANFEQQISKALYKDFSLFRIHLFQNLVKNNDLEKSHLLRLTQKLCDRIIFILFAEDRGLLTPNTIKEIREEFTNQKFTHYPLYDIYKFYFDAINKGNAKLNIPKYNGGLFATDELLDSLIIDDIALDMEAQKLSDYDFLSDVSVNILGHIFEQSLTDLEEINASIENIAFDHHKSKRKKDGVFYTPEYITRYIVEHTLGKLCTDKREELKLTEITAPQNSKKPTKKEQEIKDNLETYRDWLLHVKVLDPACGSGAFLNQALDFLIKEHESLQKDLVIMGDITAYYEIEKSILEHNLYGVDINEDAVEIAKLSLWLRTASKGRELTTLADKIKCGNSLIDDKNVAENAFVWEEEFADVFPKVMIDTNIVSNITDIEGESDKTNTFIKYSKELFNYAQNKKLRLTYSTMGEFETKKVENSEKKNIHLEIIEPLEKQCGIALWDRGGGWDVDELASEDESQIFDSIEKIILGNKRQKDVTNDAGILMSAYKYDIKYFVTNNDKDYINEGRREALERLTKIKIFTAQEFIEYFKNGKYKYGFDVVIGNPPWGAKIPDSHTKYLINQYPYVTSKSKDTYLFFSFLSLNLLSKCGLLGFIIPNTWMLINTAKEVREELLKHEISVIIDYGDGVFDNVTAESSTIIIKNNLVKNSVVHVEKYKNDLKILANNIDSLNWTNDIYKRVILEKSNDINNFILRVKQSNCQTKGVFSIPCQHRIIPKIVS